MRCLTEFEVSLSGSLRANGGRDRCLDDMMTPQENEMSSMTNFCILSGRIAGGIHTRHTVICDSLIEIRISLM